MKRRLVSTCLLWIAVLLVGIQSAHAQDGLIVGAGSTVTVNSATLDMNCLTIRIKAQGTFNLGSGTIADAGEVIVENNGAFNQGTGTIVYCPTAPPEIRIYENQTGTLIPHQGTYNLGTVAMGAFMLLEFRSEERRVGKEC